MVGDKDDNMYALFLYTDIHVLLMEYATTLNETSSTHVLEYMRSLSRARDSSYKSTVQRPARLAAHDRPSPAPRIYQLHSRKPRHDTEPAEALRATATSV